MPTPPAHPAGFLRRLFSPHYWRAKIELDFFGDQGALARTQRLALFICETLRAIARHQTFTLASALTFKTLLSLVPLLMIGMAVSMTLGTENGVSYADGFLNAIEERIPQDPMLQPLLELLRDLARRPREIAGLGFLMLFYTAYSLLSSVEWCFNYIWQVENRRPLVNRLSSYFIIVMVAPVLMSLSVYANSQIATFVDLVGARLGDFGHSFGLPEEDYVGAILQRAALTVVSSAMTCLTLALLIKMMPCARVKWRAAIWGGIFGGALIEISRYFFSLYTHHAAENLTRLYGSTLLFIPLALLWMWLSWALVLLGAEVAFALQNYHDLALRSKMRDGGLHYRLYLAVRILLVVAGYFTRGEKPTALMDEISRTLKIAPFVAKSLTDELVAVGLLRELADAEEGYVPGKELSSLTLWEVVQTLQRDKLEVMPSPEDATSVALGRLFARVQKDDRAELGKITVSDFLRQTRP
ncbi:UPF0761 membrane protein [Planctomycetales bacterium]|nr:UPF0761 membrane protein [Planctomycetales bacterium]